MKDIIIYPPKNTPHEFRKHITKFRIAGFGSGSKLPNINQEIEDIMNIMQKTAHVILSKIHKSPFHRSRNGATATNLNKRF